MNHSEKQIAALYAVLYFNFVQSINEIVENNVQRKNLKGNCEKISDPHLLQESAVFIRLRYMHITQEGIK